MSFEINVYFQKFAQKLLKSPTIPCVMEVPLPNLIMSEKNQGSTGAKQAEFQALSFYPLLFFFLPEKVILFTKKQAKQHMCTPTLHKIFQNDSLTVEVKT